MAPHDAADLAQRLARNAEAVCKHYLPAGRRAGRYWLVGDVHNTAGRSTFVRLEGPPSGKGAAGKWTDAATGEHGDLLDVIREASGLAAFVDVAAEARKFLSLPHPACQPQRQKRRSTRTGSTEAARRLFTMTRPLFGTLAETYLQGRGISCLRDTGSLRFLARCYYRPDEDAATEIWPAMIACVTDLGGAITGAHRTWLDPAGFNPVTLGKAPLETPRRSMGDLFGNAVRFGLAADVMAAGEGIETMLSLRCALPAMPMAAALSAAHLAAMLFPDTLRRLYIARDNDRAGRHAAIVLTDRAHASGIEPIMLTPALADFNEDLRSFGVGALAAALRMQIAPQDLACFLEPAK